MQADTRADVKPPQPPGMHSDSQLTATRLAWFGLAPFVLSAAVGAIGWYQEQLLAAFVVYSAVILSFLGGIHWGLAMRDGISNPQGRLVICMVPSLVAWVAVAFLPSLATLAVLGLFYMMWLRYDLSAVKDDWYGKMRKPITFVVMGTHFIWFITLASERVLAVQGA